ncbi:hypothetical protein IQ241_15110 [Romeria aff. gracilis LEGE 07310]|uniref:Uncharacterized protein n=1 Tax=Vasconcelosia minhoensis LEGE 07310 TaxID=915328 RepID=A0A8J7DC76_9CYAN|nr:hypothetical protein [Romeria gracilis]MBE9078607.1 hypothetical protein [Romeria aff. gracilis LEGE 07310]
MSFSPTLALNHWLVSLGKRPTYVVGLDSATVQLEATAKFLQGKAHRVGGPFPALAALLADAASYLPSRIDEAMATWSGWADASSPRVLSQVRSETMARWVVNQYPQRQYPAAMIGASNGAATHLCAALGIPWLPQTLLTCVRHSVDKDEPVRELAWGKKSVRPLLRHNPDLLAYQMHDPNQDRLKVGRVSYFRLKRRRLGPSFEQFLQDRLVPGGTLFLLDCQYTWLSTQADNRHYFQVGGKGKLSPEDYLQPSQQVADFLKRRGSRHRQWQSPLAHGRWPEAEWGFDPELRGDVERFAQQHGFQVCWITFSDPQDLSPLVANLYRWWYQQRGLPSGRLLSESFVYLQPWWVLRLGLVPFWAVFNDQTSLERLTKYLEAAPPYDEVYATLFSNGLYSLGIASIEQWQTIFDRANQHGQFIGVNERAYPRDNASFVRHYTDLKSFKQRYPLPNPLTLSQLSEFLAQTNNHYGVQWTQL